MDALVLLLLSALLLGAIWLAWRLSRAQKELERLAETPPASLHLLQREVQALRSGVDERLRENFQQAQELSQRIGRLQQATRQVERLSVGLDELQKILQPPQLRGAFAERLLEEALADLLPRERFALQYTFPTSGVRVDAAVFLGEGRLLALDAKFPLDNFRRYLDQRQNSESGGEAARRAFARDVRRHVDEVAAKYLSPDDGSIDVALMYIPSESIFHEMSLDGFELDGEPLMRYALSKRVVPVSPNTLYAYLTVVRLGMSGFRLQESARELLAHLGHLQSDLTELGSELARAVRQARHSLTNMTRAERVLNRVQMRLNGLGEGVQPAPPTFEGGGGGLRGNSPVAPG